jgi:YHS domain-containing protein
MRLHPRVVFTAALSIALTGAVHAGDDSATGRRAQQELLKPFAGLVGDWRGAGQPERGRAKGAWTETASWAWKLTNDSAALEAKITKGKYLKSFVLRPGKDAHAFTLEALLADGSKRTFSGTKADKKPLVLNAESSEGDGVKRITLTPLHDTRLLMLLEGGPGEGTLARLGEVGYTRQGVSFAAGESGPVCIVTEGRGTMTVSYKGKTYYVCCTGCRDLFNDDPEAVLAEAAQRKKEKSAP